VLSNDGEYLHTDTDNNLKCQFISLEFIVFAPTLENKSGLETACWSYNSFKLRNF